MQAYKGKTYIFDTDFPVYSCDALGANQSDSSITVYQGYLFKVVNVYIANAVTYLIIKFNQWPKSDFKHRLTYNVKPSGNLAALSDLDKKIQAKQVAAEENTIYFVIRQSDFASACSEYTSPRSVTVTFGTFTTPFKFRPTKSLFTSDLTLGTVVYINLKYNDSFSHGLAVGISLTSVMLDSLSTNGKVTSSSDRPALTPSLSYVLTYKGISFTLGAGIDYINKTTPLERSWIFNNKPWIGFGIGVNLFGSTTGNNTTPANTTQK